MADRITELLPPDYPWKDRFLHMDTVDSTNDCLKRLGRQNGQHGTVLLADRQANGHGRLGRSFQSPDGLGVYISVLLRPHCPPEKLMHLTCAAAVVMCQAVETVTGISLGVKWINDLVYGGRKLAGIMTELGFDSQGLVDYAVVGVGLNCNHRLEDFDPELREKAGSIAMICGKPVDRARMAAAMAQAFSRMDADLFTQKDAVMERYREKCVTVGQEISLIRGDEIRCGKALSVDADGALSVEFPDGHRESVNSGEVSVRTAHGYL